MGVVIVGFGLKTHEAMASTSALTGQYGCVTNKNFGGWDAYLTGPNFVGANYLIFLDFDKSIYQISVGGVTNYNQANALKTSKSGGVDGSITSINVGPLTGSYVINTSQIGSDGVTVFTQSLNIMPVNGGNTLLVQGGTTGNGDSTPLTGVCNKV